MNGRESGASTERTAEGPEQLMLPPLGLELDRAVSATVAAIQNQEDAPPCSTCGAIMVRQRQLLQVHQLRQHVGMLVGLVDS